MVNCSALVPPSNGAVSPSSCLSRSTYGQTCRFSCQTAGYVLEGTSTRVCDDDGEWTGNNNTFCRGNHLLFFMVFHSSFSFSKFASTILLFWEFYITVSETKRLGLGGNLAVELYIPIQEIEGDL